MSTADAGPEDGSMSDVSSADASAEDERTEDRRTEPRGRRLSVQLLRPGRLVPTLGMVADVRLPGPDEPVIALEVDLDPAEGDWAVLRVSDPSEPADPRATGEYAPMPPVLGPFSPSSSRLWS